MILFSALGGAGAVLLAQGLFRGVTPVTAPNRGADVYSVAAPTAPAPGEPVPEPRLRVNACRDLYSYICASGRQGDPTGTVKRDEEGEVEALRIYEDIIHKNPRLSIEKIDEILVKRIYTPARTKRVRETFERARTRLLHFIDYQPFQSLSQEQKNRLRKRVNSVELQLPPPASIYADEPDLFTRNDVYFERTNTDHVRIRVGGALLFTVQSSFNLAFTLAHELAHSIDPCELRSAGIEVDSYGPVTGCLVGNQSLDAACSAEGHLAEAFADWVATHIVADILTEKSASYTSTQLRSALYNTVRDLCQEGEEFATGAEIGLAASHPSNEDRVNKIFALHPAIRHVLGCKDEMGPARDSASCFWLVGPEPSPQAQNLPEGYSQ